MTSPIVTALRQPTAATTLGDPFEYEPVPLETFLYDRAYLRQPRLSDIQLDAVHHLETIYLPETEAELCDRLKWQPMRPIHFAALEWGKGSGKDTICGLTLARWVYRLLCLRDPVTYYGKAPQTFIHFLNIASSAGQASRAFFASFRELIKEAPIFKGKYEVVQGEKEPGKYEIQFAKRVMAISGHSGSASQEGLNLLGAIADEISEFKTKAEAERVARNTSREPTNTADAVIRLMRTSGRSRFPKCFKNAYISFPRFMDDAIEQLVAKGRLDNEQFGVESKWYVSGPHPTWDVNPTVDDKDDYADDYREDAAMSEAMYECKPGRATNRAFRNDSAISAAFGRAIEPGKDPARAVYYWGKDDGPQTDPLEEVDGWQARFEFNDLWPYTGCAYALHADMSINQDRAGIAMAHVRKWQPGTWDTFQGGIEEVRPIVKIDFVLPLEADMGLEPPREVQIRWFRKLVWTLVMRGFYIAWVSMDGFQSEDTLQIIESRGIESTILSCDRANSPVWKTLQDLMYDSRLEGYHHESLIHELRSLRRLSNGKVDHPDGGSKDLVDAVAGAVHGALEAGGAGEGDTPERADQGSIDMFGVGQGPATGFEYPDFGSLSLEKTDIGPPEL